MDKKRFRSHGVAPGPTAKAARALAIVGSGVVGTASGLGFRVKGHEVVFCDVSLDRVALLRQKGLPAVDAATLAELSPDAYLISVPSPTDAQGVDLSFVRSAARAVGRALARHPGWPLVVMRSTVPPGTAEDHVIPWLEEASGKRAGPDFGVCVNPEFLRAVTAEADFLSPRIIVIGALDDCSDCALRAIYAPWPDVPIVSTSLRTAEATKYVANLFNATKISFFNEMHRVSLALNADPDVAFQAAALAAEGLWNPAYGTRGGAPFGGACLPKDTLGFLRFADHLGVGELLPMLRATLRINDEMRSWIEPGSALEYQVRPVSA
jgi:UDPglucose 6-dehydrogenase